VSGRNARILFDECVGRPVVARLVEFVQPASPEGLEIRHVLDLAPAGTRDEIWLPTLAGAGWTVISADGGRTPNKNRGQKLPCLCVEYKVTLVILSPKVHGRKSFDKVRTIVSVWDRLLEIATDEACLGRRYMLEPSDPENVGIGRLSERPWPNAPSA
jgi:hypothetical protein